MNIPFTGFQSALIVWGAITTLIIILLPHQLDVIAVVILTMFICFLVAIGFHDMDAHRDDKWIYFRENKRK